MDFGQVTQASATDRHISSDKSDFNVHLICTDQRCTVRWLDTVFQSQYFPSLSITYATINKVLEKWPPQLYSMKMKICYDQRWNGLRVVIATK